MNFVTGNVKFQQDRTNLSTVSDAVSFYPSGNMSSRSFSGNINRDMSLKSGHRMTLQTDNIMFSIEPSVNYRHSNSRSQSRSLNLNIERPAEEVAEDMDMVFDGGLGSIDRTQVINATFDRAFYKSHTFDFSTIARGHIKIPKTSDVFSIFLQYNHRSDGNDRNTDYMIGYGDPATPSLMRRQHTDNSPNSSYAVIAEIGYRYIINDNWTLSLYLDQRHDHNSKESSFYMAQAEADATGDFTLGHLDMLREVLDPLNSYNSTETSQRFQINPMLRYTKDNSINFSIDIPVARMVRRLDYNRGGTLHPVKDRRWILRKGSASFIWHKYGDITSRFHAIYDINQDLPTLTRMIDITDTTNPLYTYLGNRDLSTSLTQSIQVYFGSDKRNKYSYNATMYASLTDDGYIQSRLLDTATGFTTYRWLNSPIAQYSLSESVDGSIYIKNFTLNARFESSQMKNVTMAGENTTVPTLYIMNNYNYKPQVGGSYNFGRSRIGAMAEVNFRHSTSSRPGLSSINSRDFKYGVKGVFKLPYDFGISTDFNIYQRRGYDSPQLNTTDLVLNMRLSKSFHKGRWTVAVDGFDLLHQFTNVRYSVSPSGRIESYSNTLPRYVLLHAQYKLNIMPKKKELTDKTYTY